jgi:hypothetical protein
VIGRRFPLWAALFSLGLSPLSAEAHIFGSETGESYIRITPLRESRDLTGYGSFARYEWCGFHIDPETLRVVTGSCLPIGRRGAFYPIAVFEDLFEKVERDLRIARGARDLEPLVDYALLFTGS